MLLLQLFQTFKIGMILSKLAWIDVACCMVLVLGILIGHRKGLAYLLPRLIAFIGSITLTCYYYTKISDLVHAHTSLSLPLIHAITFFILFILSFGALRVIVGLIGKLGKIEFIYFIERVIGACVGGLGALLAFSLVLFYISLFELPQVDTLCNASVLGKSVRALTPGVYETSKRGIAGFIEGVEEGSA